MKKILAFLGIALCLSLSSCNPTKMVANSYAKNFTKIVQTDPEQPFSACKLENSHDLIYTINPGSEFGQALLPLENYQRSAALEQVFVGMFSHDKTERDFIQILAYEGGYLKATLNVYGYTPWSYSISASQLLSKLP